MTKRLGRLFHSFVVSGLNVLKNYTDEVEMGRTLQELYIRGNL